MGSTHLGRQKATAQAANRNESNRTKPPNHRAGSKTNHAAARIKNSTNNRNTTAPTRARAAPSTTTTARERGRPTLAKEEPRTTTISTGNRGSAGSTNHRSYSSYSSYSGYSSSSGSSSSGSTNSRTSSGTGSGTNRGTTRPLPPLTPRLAVRVPLTPRLAVRVPLTPRLAAPAPQPPRPAQLTPPYSPPHATNPSTYDTSPPPPPSPSRLPARTAAATAAAAATPSAKQTTSPRLHLRLRPRPLPLPLAATQRTPLIKLRDHNVALVPAPTVKQNRTMGHETHTTPAATTATASTTANARPPMPSLSATAVRGINRAPLTPKIASAVRPPQPKSPNPNTTTTPLPRRTQPRPASASTSTSSSTHTLHEDHDPLSAAAFSPHLASNVTPRSGSRQSRVDSANSTPNGTPNHDRPEPWDAKSAFPFPSAMNQIHGDLSRRPLVTFSAVSPERNLSWRQDAANPQDAKFFHASDVKPSRPASTSKGVSPKNATFFYANGNGNGNGNGITPKSASPTTLSPPLSPGSSNRSQESVSSKFMYANGTPELRPTPPPVVSRVSGSTATATSKGPIVRSTAASQRPSSPNKLPQHPPSYRHSTGQPSATAAAAPAPGRVPASPTPPLMPSTAGRRRPGTAASRSGGHSRAGSWVKTDGPSEALRPMVSPITGLFPPVNLSPANPPPLTLASIIQAAEDLAEHENDESPDDQSVLQSPTKSPASPADPVTELIANARRERKVQDLQIRNTSLEAINRTLERQLRKQTAELRRFRRLSRAGHLSLASTTESSGVPSETISESELKSLGPSDLGEEEVPVEDPEEESLSDTDSASSDVSASVLAERDAKHRPRDEERLKLDLSKHQQMLIDSQKINQSIKRCMDWTEELIKDGKKALEYKVRVSDVQLGGRVLDPLDEEEENHSMLPSDETVTLDFKSIEEGLGISTSWGIEPQDRDSGIELP